MFDTKTSITARLTDAADLLIDFATLGEYGLEEPAGRAAPSCETRRRTASTEVSQRRRAVDLGFSLRSY
jgi:hypothetical protein